MVSGLGKAEVGGLEATSPACCSVSLKNSDAVAWVKRSVPHKSLRERGLSAHEDACVGAAYTQDKGIPDTTTLKFRLDLALRFLSFGDNFKTI
jgi:hypothetical protein